MLYMFILRIFLCKFVCAHFFFCGFLWDQFFFLFVGMTTGFRFLVWMKTSGRLLSFAELRFQNTRRFTVRWDYQLETDESTAFLCRFFWLVLFFFVCLFVCLFVCFFFVCVCFKNKCLPAKPMLVFLAREANKQTNKQTNN